MLSLILFNGQQTMNRNDMNNVLKITSTVFLGFVIASGLLMAALAIPVATSQWGLTVAHTSAMSPKVFAGSLVVTKPIPTSSIKENDYLVFGAQTEAPKLGKVIDFEERGNAYLVRAFGSYDNPVDIFTYSTGASVNTVAFSVPLFGYLLGLLTSPVGATIFAGVVALIGGLYVRFFFTKPAKPLVEEEEDDSVAIIKEIFDATPPQLTRRERKLIIQKSKEQESVNV